MPLQPSARRVQEALAAAGFANEVVELPDSARTAAEAAAAVGCDVAQIVKSLVFRARASGRGVLVVASGANRVDEKALRALLGEAVERADADFVREQTGFAIGGVPPLLEDQDGARLPALMDRQLLRFEELWAAAGSPYAVFPIAPAELQRLTGARLEEFTEE